MFRSQTGFFLIVAALWTGCAGPGKKADVPDVPITYDYNDQGGAMLLGEELAKEIDIRNQELIAAEGGVRIARTVILNKSNRILFLQARTQFKDAGGNTVETSPWKDIQLKPDEQAKYATPTINPKSVRFLVQIQSGIQSSYVP
jgi:hypothetical protein